MVEAYANQGSSGVAVVHVFTIWDVYLILALTIYHE